MIFRLFRRTPRPDSIASFYGVIVAQARRPAFYRLYGVPDTVNGRFEMVVLHMVLVLRRLENGSPEFRRLGQDVFDLFCRDMDGNLREMGIGDLSVPRKMRNIGTAFYARRASYDGALNGSGPELLVAALAHNVFDSPAGGTAGAERLAAYVREAERGLAGLDPDAIGVGGGFPDPERVAVRAAVGVDHDQAY
jgi:cytochrome b pre-mRNA-processing protein 3